MDHNKLTFLAVKFSVTQNKELNWPTNWKLFRTKLRISEGTWILILDKNLLEKYTRKYLAVQCWNALVLVIINYTELPKYIH